MRTFVFLTATCLLLSLNSARADTSYFASEFDDLPNVADLGCDAGCEALACDTGCSESRPCGSSACGCDPWFLFPQSNSGINLSGWVDGGFIWNTAKPASKFNGPYNGVDRGNEAMLNQFYLIAEKGLPTRGYGLGGRVDMLYGEDYLLAESFGMEKRPDGSARWNGEYYGLAFP